MTDPVTTQTAAAGWYPVEDQPGHERYWNGTAWEDATRLAPATSAGPKKSRTTLIIVGAVVLGIIMLCGIVVIGGVLSAVNVDSSEEPAATTTEESDLEDDDAIAEPESAEDPVVEEPAEEPAGPALTMGQEQAVAKGRDYLDYAAFSRKGLIDQLVFEGFSTEDATFAVDSIAPDWNAQAAKKAQEYIDYTSFSRQGLIDQLVFEGFSQAQAEYGAKAVGY